MRVTHRGITAYQSIFHNAVLLVRDGKAVKHIRINKKRTEDDLRKMIDEFIEGENNANLETS